MYGTIATLAFVGVEARAVEVQVRVTPGAPAFVIVGLPDKAVAESRERVRNALHAVGLGLPYKHVTVNLAPADLPKEGSHFDLAIVLGLMVAMEAIAPDAIERFAAVGELALDGSIRAVPGALPAAIGANAMGKGPHLPGRVRARGGLGRRGCGHAGRAASACRSSITSKACRRSRGPSRRSIVQRACCPICATCAARRAPSARSKSRRPVGITS